MTDLAFFVQRGIATNRLPEWVLRKAAGIIARIENGEHFQAVGGKRPQHFQNVISIPVGPVHRILASDETGKLVFRQVMTHEQYNKYCKRKP